MAGGSEGYDVSGMVNLPLGNDRLALRLVGFTAEDAGYIDNVLAESPGGTFDNADVTKKDVNSIQTSGGRAALRFDISENVDLTLSAIYQEITADGHSDVTPGAGDLKQVRFGNESLSDEWYQLALTLNASLSFGDLVVAGSYFDRKFAYEADASEYEFSFNQSGYVSYDFGGDPRGFATNNEDTEIETLEVRLQSNHDAESRWSWLGGRFLQQGNRPHGIRQLRARLRGHAVVRILQLLRAEPDRQLARRHRQVVAGHLRHRSFAEGACSERSASTSRKISRSRPAAAGSSTTAHTACSSRRRRGFTGAKFLDDKVDNERGRFGLAS